MIFYIAVELSDDITHIRLFVLLLKLFLSGLFFLFLMTRRKENIAIHFRNFSPSLQAYKEIFYGGSPSLMRQGLACVATLSLNVAAGVYGDSAIAAMSIVGRIAMLSFAAVIGLGQGFQPVCGFCYGAGLYDRLKEAYKFTVILGTTFLVVVAVVGWALSGSLIGIFRDDAEVIAIGVVALRWQLCTFPLNAFILASNMLAQTCRKPWRAHTPAAGPRPGPRRRTGTSSPTPRTPEHSYILLE